MSALWSPPVLVSYGDELLELLYTQGVGAEHYPESVVSAYLRRVRTIEAAVDERDLRAQKSLRFEALKGRQYRGKFSLRLNDRWRLIITVGGKGDGRIVTLHEISNHYGD
jgi:proteic killer suppression protein